MHSFTDSPSCGQPWGHERWELLGEHWAEAELNVVGKPDDLRDLIDRIPRWAGLEQQGF